ncbi:acyltransferase [Rhodococcus sp. 06-418-5]|uniref:acyltransferase family protein n=1 Tax=Rhodococcus sp. 06-418-5 TaxID=2022507 RepID=UPI000B9BE672|nr:acyltransferase family protein [Rhodococcus sp. 06-418-5]OZC81301.1 acyltransferase [Rhodococcus sp. 06-418-5]
MAIAVDEGRSKRVEKRSHTRLDLQGMRAVAVLAVFADHLFGWPSGGFVGVDVFFVLSGFFITGRLIREREKTGAVSFGDFYVKRARRIIPSAMLVLVVTVALAYALFPAIRAKQTLVDGLYAAVFAANIHFEQVGTDYFQVGQPPSPLQHYWSLSIEEQFYFVWPLLLIALYAVTRRYHRRRNPWIRKAAIFGAMAVICLASFAWAAYQSVADPSSAYFSTFTRVWELGIGALLAICGPFLAKIPRAARPATSYLGLAGVAASLFLITATSQFPAPWAALPVLSTALVVAAFHGSEVRGVPLLTNPVAQYVGDTSYTLYLWHWPVIILLTAVLPENAVYYVLALVVAFGLTEITYRFYEKPIRDSRWLESTSSKGFVSKIEPSHWLFAAVMVAALCIGSIISIALVDRTNQTGQATQALVVEQPIVPVASDVAKCLGAAAMVNEGCELRDPDKPLQPSVDTFADDTQGAYECYRTEGKPLRSCTYGYQRDDAKRLAIIGDSHAGMLLPALSPYLSQNKWSLTTYVGYGCQWQLPPSGDCSNVMNDIQAVVLAENYDAILTTSSRKFGGSTDQAAVVAYSAAWAPVARTGTKVIAIADNPTVTEESMLCVTRVSLGSDSTGECGASRDVALADRDPLFASVEAVPGASLIDLTDYYCTADRCPTVIGDVIAYRDTGGHLSATFAKTLSQFLVPEIATIVG